MIVPNCLQPPGKAGRLRGDYNAPPGRNYQAGRFTASGVREARTGGVQLFTPGAGRLPARTDDDYAAEALRDLGGCAQEAGDLPLARRRWERSAELAQRAG